MRPLPCLLLLAGLGACAPTPTPPVVLSGGPGMATGAESACVSAVEGQTERTGVTVAASEASATGTTVTLDVPGAAAPWTCVTDHDGRVSRVTYSGDAA